MKTLKFKLQGNWNDRTVLLNGKPLSPSKSQKVRNHSPDGFNWGYSGSGPAQLALAIMLEFLPDEQAQQEYQNFKFSVIAGLPQADFDTEIEYTTKNN